MSQGCADLTFGLQPQALAIAHLLSGKVPDFAVWDEEAGRFDIEIETRPWYSGRERAICLMVYLKGREDQCLYLVFGEDRRTDQLFVERWVGPRACWNPSTTAIHPEHYENMALTRHLFDAAEAGQVADYLFERMAEHYEYQSHTEGQPS